MRRQGRELAVMALYAIDGLPSFERRQALVRFWQLFVTPEVHEGLFEPSTKNPHPMEEPALWKAFDAMTEEVRNPNAQFRSAREFATDRIAGILEHQSEIDNAIRKASRSWPLHRMPQVDRSILRLGAYELLHCEDVPPAAAINEAIEIGKRYADRQSRSFINGILDRIFQTSSRA
ncbi:MAG: transcription antitermination factor NusB [Deltaproteobacteria bacterium]|nr:MAG: transcription antitermination factor NusB [Deltaproteobacteria bacterium]